MTQNDSDMNPIFRSLIAGLCMPFLVSGMTKLADLGQASQEMAELGLGHPDATALWVVTVQLGGSILTIFYRGMWAATGALALAGFTVCATWIAHAFWTVQGAARFAEMNTFLEHASIVFALLMVAWWHAMDEIPRSRRRSAGRDANDASGAVHQARN